MVNKKGNILVIILPVIALIAAGLFGIYYFKNSQKPTPTIIDETANWKTYTNTRYGYSINYPSNIVYQETKTEGSIVGQQETTTNFDLNGGTLIIYGNAGGLGLEGFETTQINVGGISTYKVFTSSTSGIISAITSPKNDDIYFNFILPEDTNKQKEVDIIFDQILSTFKFL